MTNAESLESAILVYGNIMQVLPNRVAELKKERQDIRDTYNNEKLLAKQLHTEINKMEHVLKKYKVAIKDEMIKKFKMETDWSFVDNMEMAVINYMIIQVQSNADERKEHFIRDIKLLEVYKQYYVEKKELLSKTVVYIFFLDPNQSSSRNIN